MKTFVLFAVMALVPSLAFATNCHQQVVVQRVVNAHHVQPVVTFVQPVRQVQFVEVRDHNHHNNVQRIVVQQQNDHHNHHAQAVVVQEVKVVRVQQQRQHHNNNRVFFQRILGR